MKKNTLVIMVLLIISGLGSLNFFTQKKSTPLEVVKNFDITKYLGTWYEIARFDYKWEKNLDQVTATYSKRDDGKIKVQNQGHNSKTGNWEESIGKAKFAQEQTIGALKVSFFGPFYVDYKVILLDDDYRYALVTGESKDYLWLLSRTPTIPEEIREQYVTFAEKHGFDTSKLIWVKHEKK